MNLDKQISNFINNAPKYGITKQEVALVAPVLKNFALELKHLQYYILQSSEQHWLITTLSKRNAPDLQKNVVYAFPSHRDAVIFPTLQNTPFIPKKLLIIDILSQLLAISAIDSIVFFEVSGNFNTGTEVSRQNLLNTINRYLQQYNSPQIPPDLA